MINSASIKILQTDKKIRVIAIGVVVSMVFVIIIKGIIRPLRLHFSEVGVFFIGTLPNFFAATGFCSLIFVYTRLFSEKKKFLQSIISRLNFSSIITFIGLAFWEVIQKFLGYPMDFYDILMTGVGCICTYLFILTLYKTDKN